MHFWQVAMKPGKPLAFGLIQGVPIIGLPGNPVASMIAFDQILPVWILIVVGYFLIENPVAAQIDFLCCYHLIFDQNQIAAAVFLILFQLFLY